MFCRGDLEFNLDFNTEEGEEEEVMKAVRDDDGIVMGWRRRGYQGLQRILLIIFIHMNLFTHHIVALSLFCDYDGLCYVTLS